MQALIIATLIAEYLVLFLMFGLSIWSISIILERRKVFQLENIDSEKVHRWVSEGSINEIREWSKEGPGLIRQILKNQAKPMDGNLGVEVRQRLFESNLEEEKMRLEKGLSVLATLGANAPFIGLFGTVLGIIRAFAYLGNQSGSASVMSGVSQALYATAVGLFVAIPAVVAFNYFQNRLRQVISQATSLKDLYLVQVAKGNNHGG